MRKYRTERRTSSPPPSLSLACLQAGDLKNRGRPRGNVAKSYRRARFLTGDWDSRGVVSPRGVKPDPVRARGCERQSPRACTRAYLSRRGSSGTISSSCSLQSGGNSMLPVSRAVVRSTGWRACKIRSTILGAMSRGNRPHRGPQRHRSAGVSATVLTAAHPGGNRSCCPQSRHS